MSRDDVLWLAGLLEGEGTFDAHRGKYLRVRVAMTDRDVVQRVADLMGTTNRLALHKAPHKPTWHAELSGPRAAEVMRTVLPHMGARRSSKIAEVLAVVEYRGGSTRSSVPGPSLSAVA